jgi:hypothetical protein
MAGILRLNSSGICSRYMTNDPMSHDQRKNQTKKESALNEQIKRRSKIAFPR